MEAARAFGRLSAAVLATGRIPRRRAADLMIAAVAVVHDMPLYTTNPGDFTGLEEHLDVIAVRPRGGP